jgi:hypothetical protein
MGQGSSPSAAGGASGAEGGGMGLGILSSLGGLLGGLGGGQGPSSGATSPSTTPYYIENPNIGRDTGGGAGGGGGLIAQLGQLLKDPQVLQSLSDVTKNLGKTIAAGDKVPGHAAAMLMQASQPQPSQASPSSGTGPFLGDIPNFSPQQAQTLLQAMGIPGGFQSLNPRG